jgi:peptidoglycan/xylan/chitin deacetylase (PgdA/CDA1 family)
MGEIRLPVLMYHDLGPSMPGMFPEVIAPEEFERQVAWLADHGYTGIRPSDWAEWRRKGKTLPDKPVLITFDDGYAGVATYGFPILERYGFGAVVFIVTERIGFTNTWDEALGYDSLPLMSGDEISRWASRGIEFGSHSRTHPDLTSLSEAAIQCEVVGSRDDLAAIVNRMPTSFSYPWGTFNQAVQNCVRNTFDLAFSTRRGINFRGTDPHLLRRSQVHPDRSKLDFACRVNFGLNPLAKFDALFKGPAAKAALDLLI